MNETGNITFDDLLKITEEMRKPIPPYPFIVATRREIELLKKYCPKEYKSIFNSSNIQELED